MMNPMMLLMMPQEGGQGGFGSFLPLLLVIVVFYFFFIRPQMKKSKDQRRFREGLKKGDKIVTLGGIHGKILEVADTTLIIEVEGQNKLKIEKSSVAMEAASSGQLEQHK